jgi:glucose-specific phosphotransferase system IIA component
MIPVSVLPAAGLLVALGRFLQDNFEGTVKTLGDILFSGGLAIFQNLALIFAIGAAIGFTGGAGVAGLAAGASYYTLTNILKVLQTAQELPDAIDTGVFGGIMVGFVAAYCYRRFHETKLTPVLGFFSGKRLVPIMAVTGAFLLALLLGVVWPPIQHQIAAFGTWVMGSEWGPAFYAAGKRALIPVGLHHVYYAPFLYQFGEFTTATGEVLKGEAARYFAGDHTAGRFMASEFPIMLFGLPAACAAMVLRARPEKRKLIAGGLTAAALTSIITGITEPIEFSFIFVAPLLYVFHVVAAFLSGVLTQSFDIQLGYTFSASVIDLFLGWSNQKNALSLLIVGPIVAAAYFTAFYTLIPIFNFMTPGREVGSPDVDEDESMGSNLNAPSGATAGDDRIGKILAGLGGAANIQSLDACITRLRLQVADPAKVNVNALKKVGATGAMNAGGGNYQVIFGVESDSIKEALLKRMSSTPVASASAHAERVVAPLAGNVMSLEQVPDQTFSSGMMGVGLAIDPTEGLVVAPLDATVATAFRTGHAIGLVTERGVEILIHVGIDTVKMNGEGFEMLVKQGQKVKAGDPLIRFDLDLVRKKAKSTITPILITNPDIFKKVSWGQRSGTIERGKSFFQIEFQG